jgi:hypothetical protein
MSNKGPAAPGSLAGAHSVARLAGRRSNLGAARGIQSRSSRLPARGRAVFAGGKRCYARRAI